jgi:2-polyprenyl-3-methyl-5-hydroxy-6-metoxy-1,4-benzoquinol methylase
VSAGPTVSRPSVSLRGYFSSKTDLLYRSSRFRSRILRQIDLPENRAYTHLPERQIFEKIFLHHVEEAELSLSLLTRASFRLDHTILEIGGGIGLLYAFLKTSNYQIHALEPSESGFAGYYESALDLFTSLGIDGDTWYPYRADEAGRIGQKFDIIFSNNVFEHIPDLKPTLLTLKNILQPNGLMIHNTVNYLVPYEPHFKILLVPFYPRATSWFKTSLKASPLWNGLNFITTGRLEQLCAACGLRIDFERDVMSQAFLRLDTDPEFASRQGGFRPILRFLKLCGLLKVMDRIPVSLTTPITFRIYQ